MFWNIEWLMGRPGLKEIRCGITRYFLCNMRKGGIRHLDKITNIVHESDIWKKKLFRIQRSLGCSYLAVVISSVIQNQDWEFFVWNRLLFNLVTLQTKDADVTSSMGLFYHREKDKGWLPLFCNFAISLFVFRYRSATVHE